MKPNTTLTEILTQLASLNTTLSLLAATLQDLRWWLSEQGQKGTGNTGEDQLTFWSQYQPHSNQEK